MNKASLQVRNPLFWRRLAKRGEFVKSRLTSPPHRALSSARPLPEDHVNLDQDYQASRVVRKKAARSTSLSRLALAEPEPAGPGSSALLSLDDPDASNDPFESKSPMTLKFIDRECPIVSKLHLVTPDDDVPRGVWPVFRLMVSLSLIL